MANKKTWTTRDGEELDVSKMDYSHIVNALNYFKGRESQEIKWLKEEKEKRDRKNDRPIESRFEILDIRLDEK